LGVSEASNELGKASLRDHVNDSHAVNLLIHFLAPFSPATSKTRAAFDTRTSAIHIAPNTYGRYNIEELKGDALWLSKEVGIDELASLRIVVLEWQTRSANWLRGDCADDDTTASHRGREPSLQSSLLGSTYRLGREPSGSGASFDSTQPRRIRLLKLYLSERQYLTKTAEYISVRALCKYSLVECESNGDGATKGGDWLSKVGHNLISAWKPSGTVPGKENWLLGAIAALRLRIQNLEEGSGWLQEEDTDVDVERAWCRIQVTEMIHIMEVILNITISSTKPSRKDFVRSWFSFVGDYAFFEQFELVRQITHSHGFRLTIY
jgi:nuclear pore complex protein Nup188